MRILFVAPRFHTNQYQMVKTLQEKKHSVFFHVASLGATEDHNLVTPVRYDQSRLSLMMERFFGKGGVNRPNYFPKPIRYWKVFRNLKPEMVIIRDPYKVFSIMVAFFSLFIKAKIIFYTQEALFRSRSKKTKLKQRLTLSFFKAAWMTPILGNKYEKNHIVRHMYYVPLPVPVKPAGLQRNELNRTEPRILMVGKYNQDRKNHLLLVKAVSLLKEKYNFKVTIVGECSREQQQKKFAIIKEAIQHAGLTGIINLQQNVPYCSMEALYASHHLFVLPAIDEQYGVSVTEALAYGLPAICTDSCGARYNIRNGENGFVIKSNSLEALTSALETLIADRAKICEMSEKALNYVHRYLSGDAFYARLLHLMKERFHMQGIY